MLDRGKVEAAKRLLTDLPIAAPGALGEYGISDDEWPVLLRGAVESIRGTQAASPADKRRFIATVLDLAQERKLIKTWTSVDSAGRQDYGRVSFPG